MLEKTLDHIAEWILGLDEASLTELLPEYKKRMDHFEPTREWEKAVIIFFLINSVRVKNALFNEGILKKTAMEKPKSKKDGPLKIVK